QATIMPVKIGDCKGPFALPMAKGILYAAHNGAEVINLSLGISGKCSDGPSYLSDAITQAENAGALVVAAGGNDSLSCTSSPANLGGVIAVGATAPNNSSRASFSNWGSQITVVAPGVNIVSTVPNSSFDMG